MNKPTIESPHADLQTALSHLGRLNPRTRKAPAFSNRDAAEHVIAISAQATGRDVNVTPVWVIDHGSLTDSEIIAWSVTDRMN